MQRALRLLFALICVAALLPACVRNPVTGQNELSLIDEGEEIKLGREASKEFSESVGFYDDHLLTDYVVAIGTRLGRGSHRGTLPWSFEVLDDPTPNAFSMPGGQVFVTRGLLAYLNSEAELATVLGHEIGHVTARHGARQMTDAAIGATSAGLVGIFSADMGQAMTVSNQLMLLKHGRADEDQSDQLGFQYAIDQGYDGRAMVSVLSTLSELEPKTEAQGRVPEWLSTHPDTLARRDATLARINGQWARKWDALVVRHDEYLNHVAGLPFGDDPRIGFFDATGYVRPDLKIRVRYPTAGWETEASRYSAVWAKPREALMELDVLDPISPDDAMQRFLQLGIDVRPAQATNFGGHPGTLAPFFVRTRSGLFAGYLGYVPMGEVTVQLITLVEMQKAAAYQDAFREWMAAFGTLSDPKMLHAAPAHLEVVEVRKDMTLDEFTVKFPSSVSMETVRILNGLPEKDPIFKKGQLAKRVVGTAWGVK